MKRLELNSALAYCRVRDDNDFEAKVFEIFGEDANMILENYYKDKYLTYQEHNAQRRLKAIK